MKVYIDASIFTRGGSFGMVTGEIDLPHEPQIGDTIMLGRNAKSGAPPNGFSGSMTVTGRIHVPTDTPLRLSLSLEDITVETVQDAQMLITYFEKGFGLHVHVYDNANEPH